MLSDAKILEHLDEIILDYDSDDDFINEIEEFDEKNYEELIETESDNYQNNTVHFTPCTTASSTQQRILPSKQRRPVSKEQINPKWKKRGVFVPKVHHFDTSKSGIQKAEFELSEESTVLDFFEAFVSPNLLGKISFETNQYCHKYNIQTPYSRVTRWTDTQLCVFGFDHANGTE
eukprot:XP_016657869.1 PREDICTED: uncharacterized protein LOC107883052 [Acyrthosiphon pisum]